jgi:hypothetical protein
MQATNPEPSPAALAHIRALVPAVAASLIVGIELVGRSGAAQALAPMVGASAIQGSLQSIPAGMAPPALDGIRNATQRLSETTQQRNAAISAAAGGGSTAEEAVSAPPAAPSIVTGAPGTPGMSTARVNGQPIPICSHGAPCHAAMRRAMLMGP